MSIDPVLFDLRQVLRSLRRRPAYVAAALATLVLVLAANATLFAAINATLFRPTPFRSGEKTVSLVTWPPGLHETRNRNPLHAVDLAAFRVNGRILRDVSAYDQQDRMLTGGTESQTVRGVAANASLFQLLADRPEIGRAFTEDEEERGMRLAVLSHNLWRSRFGQDRAVLGETLELDGQPHTIVGVMPESFPPPWLPCALITPLGITRSAPPGPNRTYLPTLARLQNGATLADANAEVRRLMEQVVRDNPKTHTGWTAAALSFREFQYGSFRAPLLALFAAMALLMLIASANIASLTLANVSARRSEIALRRAIGASSGALARLVVIEVAVLNLAGAAGGILLATLLLPALVAIDPEATRTLGKLSIDWRVMGYAFGSALFATAVSCLVPAMNVADCRLGAQSFGSGTRTHGGRSAHRWRALLLVSQTALCLVLLVCGGLLLRAFQRSTAISPGFDPVNVLTAQVRLPGERYATAPARILVMEQLFERIRGIPGVVEVSQTLNRFEPGQTMVTLIDIEGQPTPDNSQRTVLFRRVGQDYFRIMRIRQLRGRAFTARDSPDAPLAVVISRSLAEKYWPGADPLGRRIRRGTGPWITVIGVVDDASDVDLLQPPEPALYVPWTQNNNALNPVALVIRTSVDPDRLGGAVRSAVLSVDPNLPVDRLQPLERFLANSLAPQRFRATLLSLLVAVGLLLGAVGVAGVTARSIAERMGEFGVRLALGCDQAGLWRDAVLREFRIVAWGCALGLLLAIGAGRFMSYLLPEIGAIDYLVMACAAGVLLATSLAAASIPAARVLRLDSLAVLRP